MKPRVGIISQNSLASWIHDSSYINVSEESRYAEARAELIAAGHDEGSDAFLDGMQEYSDSADDSDGDTVLVGDWARDAEGRYVPDTAGIRGYAIVLNHYSNIASVEWSRTIIGARDTSPCYRMADGSGPCGDLDALADDGYPTYDVPSDMREKK